VADRDLALDQLRGLSIVAMLWANALEHVRVVPAWLKHAPDVGLTVVDLIAPTFIFAVGLTWGASVRRRAEQAGAARTIEWVVRRSMALVGLGALFTLGETSYGFNPHGVQWGTLQAIGMASLLSAPLVFFRPRVRLGLALVLAAAYQWALDASWLPTVLASSHAGLQGSLSWTALLLLSTVFGDLARRQAWGQFGALAVALGLAGMALAPWFPVSKHRMSVSFDLVVVALAAGAYLASRAWVRWQGGAVPGLVTWGRNPLVLYISHLFALAVLLVPAAPGWHVEAPAWLAVLQVLGLQLLLHAWALWLERRGLFFTL